MASLIERHRDRIEGVLSCFDRVLIQGTLPSVCYAGAMSTTLDSRGIKVFDYATEFAQPFREAIRARAERVAAEARRTRRTHSQEPLPRSGVRRRRSRSLNPEILAFLQSIVRRTDYPYDRPRFKSMMSPA